MRLPHEMVMFIGQAWLPAGAEVTIDHEHDAYAWWPRRRRRLAGRGRRAAAADGRAAAAGRERDAAAATAPRSRSLSFPTLKALSFTHSTIYTCLLVVWLVPGLAPEEMVFGFAHGIGWICMVLLILARAARARRADAHGVRGHRPRRDRAVLRELGVRPRGAPARRRSMGAPMQRPAAPQQAR